MQQVNFLISLTAILLPFLLTVALVPVIRRLALKFLIVDDPASASRKIHQTQTALLGGWALFLSVFFVLFLFRLFNWGNFSMISDVLLLAVFAASLILMIGGTLDDKYNLKPYQQVIFPILAVALALFFGLKIGYVTNPLGLNHEIIYFTAAWGVVTAGLWLLAMMYATKFLDGLDGLVTGLSGITSFFIFLVSLSWDVPQSATGLWALMLLGSSLGFLLFNYRPAKIFLGEGGSVFIGFTLGFLSIISGSKVITTLLVMGLPLLDVAWVVVQRLVSRKSPFTGDRRHLHYRLLDLGFNVEQAVWLLWLLAIGFGALGAISSSYGKMILTLFLVLFMAVVSYWLKRKNQKNSNQKV